ncbi:probable polygalacturonase isoform X1 [Oryza glaberrima]|uniref:Pectate lyase superfamily protein domain-containing protein n=5 Tax=Oryza TaxID=4527 RepID=A0A0E0I3V3_ORYNI|nr:probable polygalacturonase isoform X1 [Oryza glaberrima]
MARLVVLVVAMAAVAVAVGVASGEEEAAAARCARRPRPRPHSVTISEFGAVGDGVTVNTLPFQNAIFYLRSFADKGGAQLYVPRGRWLTGSFNLTSHLTIFLEKDAVIIGAKEVSEWPIVEPLPSYGQGIDLPGARHRSLINGHNVTDVVITGNNGIIDGQGLTWWNWFRSNKLNYSRPHLVEFVDSEDIVISNLTLLNSPAWGIHPVFCSNVMVHDVTIRTSLDAPLTDGIVPDSCSNMCIEDSSISVAHDAISLKSGWDNYGITIGRPASDIHISRVDLQASLGAALAFGSEMSGGISDIHVDHLNIHGSSRGILFKTAPGRGGYIRDVVISDVQMEDVNVAIKFTGDWSTHPDNHFDPSALPMINRITLKNMVGTNISVAGVLSGINGDPFTNICLSNISFSLADSTQSSSWSCSNISGYSELVFPEPCPDLHHSSSNSSICFSLLTYHALAAA